MITRATLVLLLLTAGSAAAQTSSSEGVLLLAHGGRAEWNERVMALAGTIDRTQPTEVAFGMASRPAIQSAVDKLVARGVTSIVAVPLFVSSHSSVITSTAYLLGLRDEMPPDLKVFAKMSHGAHGGGHGARAAAGHEGHEGHGASPPDGADNTRPVKTPVPIRMTDALDGHRIVGEILLDRAREISTSSSSEAVIIVAHGPVPEEDNRRWLADMKVLAEQMASASSFGAIRYLTVRDDAPAAIRDQATEELRSMVSDEAARGRRVLIVPLLLSYGGIEQGIKKRLEGLSYVMAERALMPDTRLAEWVRQSIAR